MSAHNWFYFVLGDSTYKYLRYCFFGSNLDIACTVPSYKFIVYFVSFCFSVHLIRSGFTLFQVVPACPKRSYCYWWLQIVPGGCSSFQVVPPRSRSFQLDPRFSIYAVWVDWFLKSQGVLTTHSIELQRMKVEVGIKVYSLWSNNVSLTSTET